MESNSNCHHTTATGILDPYSDADAFMEWYSDERVGKFCSWDTFTSKEAAIDHVINTVTLHPWHKAIASRTCPSGHISVTPFPSDDGCRAEIGCLVGSASSGKGIATQAVKMAANEVFVECEHMELLEAVVDVKNPASQRVLEKAGVTREGVLRKYCTLRPSNVVMFSSCPLIPKSTISCIPEIFRKHNLDNFII